MRCNYHFDDVADADKVWHPDGRRFFYWYVSKDVTDHFDDDTGWDVKVWDQPTGELLLSDYFSHKSGHAGTSGEWLSGVRWADDGTCLVYTVRGEPERQSKPVPEPSGG